MRVCEGQLPINCQTREIAKEAGSSRSGNMVILGAATPFIDMPYESIEDAIRKLFDRKGQEVVEANLKALKAGRKYSEK